MEQSPHPLRTNGASSNFSTPDLAATFERTVLVPTVDVWQEPHTRMAGVRDAVLIDPIGTVVRLTRSST
jgi:hypothetical protein